MPNWRAGSDDAGFPPPIRYDIIRINVLCGALSAETWGRLGQRVADLAKIVEDRTTFPVDFNIQHKFEVSSESKPAQVRS